MGESMKAIVFTRYGSADDLELRNVARPVPADDEILIRIRASSINSWDWEYLNGTPFVNRLMFGLFRPRPGKQRLGADIAGTVEQAGARVSRFQVGDEVFGDLWDNWGGFAEFVCAKESSLEPKPANATFAQAAAIPQAGVLALQGLRKCAELRRGMQVLVNGAGGGVGTFAIQLARLSGAEVTAVDASHKLDLVRSLGAVRVIDYAREDFTQIGAGYDLIIDCQNFRSMSDIKRALNANGTYAMIGGSMLRVLQLWWLSLFDRFARGHKKLCLVAEGPNKGLGYLKELVEAGQLVPCIDKCYPLHQVPDALRYFGEGRHRGKIVITM